MQNQRESLFLLTLNRFNLTVSEMLELLKLYHSFSTFDVFKLSHSESCTWKITGFTCL